MRAYAELAVTTNFSFLRRCLASEEIVAQAAALGLSGIGIADHNSFAGVVRAHVALREWARPDQGRDGFADLHLAIGVRLVFADDTPDLLAYPRDRAAYGRLCRLLTLGKRRAPKGACHITRNDLATHAQECAVHCGWRARRNSPLPWWRGDGGEGVSESRPAVMTGADAITGSDHASSPLTPVPLSTAGEGRKRCIDRIASPVLAPLRRGCPPHEGHAGTPLSLVERGMGVRGSQNQDRPSSLH